MTPFRGIKKVAVLGGGGLMGHGIVLACLRDPELEIMLVSHRQESLDKGMELLRNGPYGLESALRRGKIDEEQLRQMLGRVRRTLDYDEGLGTADLIVESVPEVVSTKHEVLRHAQRSAPPGAIFTTNTSSIMIAELAMVLDNPGRLIGTHWFYPSNVMRLVEVARSNLTDVEVLAKVVDFLSAIGKRPVVVADAPGFFMTRFINTYIAEAVRLVELGIAGPAEIDEMVKIGLGWPMGVFELLDDTASFDSWYHAQEYLHETCGERYAIPPLARKVFSAGYRGSAELKPGSRGGWYDYLAAPRPSKD